MTRVLRIFHAGVVAEYQQREALLRARHGYDVHLACPPVWREAGARVYVERTASVPVHVMPVRGSDAPNLFWYHTRELTELIRRLRPDIVDLHEEPFSLAAAGALIAMGAASSAARVCFYTAQNLPKQYPPPFSMIERAVFRRAGAAYPCSTEAGERLRLRGFGKHLHVLPLGVTMPNHHPRARGPIRVGFVGRLEPYKGPLIAVHAFADAARDRNATMEILGVGPQEPLLRDTVKQLGIASRVTFRGGVSQSDALRRIADLSVLIVPSLTTNRWKEQFGRVAVQAMAAGTVVLAFDSGALAEVVGPAGVLVAEGDLRGLSNALRILLDDHPRRVQLGRIARERAERLFSWEAVASGMNHMYQGLLNDSRESQSLGRP